MQGSDPCAQPPRLEGVHGVAFAKRVAEEVRPGPSLKAAGVSSGLDLWRWRKSVGRHRSASGSGLGSACVGVGGVLTSDEGVSLRSGVPGQGWG